MFSDAHISQLYNATGFTKVSNSLLYSSGGGGVSQNDRCSLYSTLVAFSDKSFFAAVKFPFEFRMHPRYLYSLQLIRF